MRATTKFHRLLVLPIVIFATAACEDSATNPEPEDLVVSVREATLRYQSTSAAIADGYAPDEHCVAHPELGGMGYHWVNQSLVDPEFDAMKPEALLYAPVAGGGHRLVGVEYIVINAGQPRPQFDGQPFDDEGVPPLMEAGVPHWSLHVWVHEPNPTGIFAAFNPQVSCD